MATDGPDFHDDMEGAAHRLPGTLPPNVRENLRRAAARRKMPAPDPLGRRRRRWLRRLVGWLAGRFEAAADAGHPGAVADRHYASLLRRVEGDMLLREEGVPAAPQADAAPNMGRAVGLETETRPADDPAPAGKRPDLRVVK